MSVPISYEAAVATLQSMFEHIDQDVIAAVLDGSGAEGGPSRGGQAPFETSHAVTRGLCAWPLPASC